MNQLAPIHPTVVPMRARDYAPAQLALIRRTVASDCNDNEFNLFMEVAKRVGLDAFRRQIHAVVYNKDKPDKRKMSIIVGIDGFRAVAERSGKYRPDEEETRIEYDPALKSPANPIGIVKAVTRCWKYGPDGQWYPITGVAYWDEFAALKEIWRHDESHGKRVPTGEFELGGNWPKMGRVMISKCSEAQAIRKGWPEDLSGVYAPEEMERATVIDVTATEVIEEHAKEERMKLVGAKDGIAIMWSPAGALEMVPVGKMADKAIEFFAKAKTEAEITGWRDTNRVSLQRFWAEHKNDALGVKTAMEKRLKELATTAPARAQEAAAQAEASEAHPS